MTVRLRGSAAQPVTLTVPVRLRGSAAQPVTLTVPGTARFALAFALGAAALFSQACNCGVSVNPEGYACDTTNPPCPVGYVCVAGVCRNQVTCANGGCGGGSGGGAGGGSGSCEGVVCDAPPASFCADANTLRNSALPGSCSNGSCNYVVSDVHCNNGCASTPTPHCTGQNLCEGVTCNTPPASLCINANTVRSFAATGNCDSNTGKCSYDFNDKSCAGGCQNGACVSAGLTFSLTAPRVKHEVNAIDQAPGSAGQHVLAVGKGGAVSKWNGTTWTRLNSGTTADLHAVYLASGSSGFIVGDNRTVLAYDGSSLTPVTLVGALGSKLVSVHGSGPGHVVIADETGVVFRNTAGTFVQAPLFPTTHSKYVMTQVFVDASNRERVSGACSSVTGSDACILYAGTAAAATWYDDTSSADSSFASVGPSTDTLTTNTAFAGQTTAVVSRHNGTDGTFDTTGVPVGLSGGAVIGMTGTQSSTTTAPVWVATEAHLSRWTGTTLDPSDALDFYLATPGAHQVSMSRNESTGVIVADSSSVGATIWRRSVNVNQVLEFGEDFQAVGFQPGASTPTLYVMNVDGDIGFRPLTAPTWSFSRSPTITFSDLVVGSAFQLALFQGGGVYKVTNGVYAKLTSPTSQDLNAGCRVSDTEMYLVGKGGTILSFNGSGLSAMNSSSSRDLADVACGTNPGNAVAVGQNGAVLRLSGNTWSSVAPAFPDSNANLTSVALAPNGAIYVAGPGAFGKLENGTWAQLPALPNLGNLEFVSGSEIYASNGAQVVRFDGGNWTTSFTAPTALVAGAAISGRVVFVGANGTIVEGQ